MTTFPITVFLYEVFYVATFLQKKKKVFSRTSVQTLILKGVDLARSQWETLKDASFLWSPVMRPQNHDPLRISCHYDPTKTNSCFNEMNYMLHLILK